ncbi:MAG: membrane protein insertase YidC [Planctomycetota bacterium]
MDRNARLALILFLAILFIHVFVVAPRLSPPPHVPPAPATRPAQAQAETRPSPETRPASPRPRDQGEPAGAPAQLPPSVAVEETQEQEIPAEAVTLETDLLRVELTNEGAAITKVTLQRYEDPFEERPLDLLSGAAGGGNLFSFRLASEHESSKEPQTDDNAFPRDAFRIVERAPTSVTFARLIAKDLELRKTFALRPDRYFIDAKIELRNLSSQDVEVRYVLAGPGGIGTESTSGGSDISGCFLSTLEAPKLNLVPLRALRKAPRSEPLSGRNWTGVLNSYFAAVLQTPGYEKVKTAVFYPIKDPDGSLASVAVDFESAGAPIPAGASVAHDFTLFCGPKDDQVLKDYGPLEKLISYGFTAALARIVVVILRFFHEVPPHNWGLAIILLTIVIRLALFPLSRHSQIQTHRMQTIQPELKKLQQKHKGDKQKLAEEQMKLWRRHGANPVGGCLMPLLIQLPVFIALFQALRNAIELRKAGFLPWIVTDLSKPDVLFTLPFTIPFLNTDAVRILPVLSSLSMILSQRKTPVPSDDPQALEQQRQQKMMMIMMSVFLLFMFYNFPSGLMLYWTLSSLWGVLEQRLIQRHLHPLDASSDVETKTRGRS